MELDMAGGQRQGLLADPGYGSRTSLSSRPMRGFTWRAKQRHRPGLEVMAPTGRKHGFEWSEEMRLLVALDFLRASEVLSQPFRMDFEQAGGQAWHIPDFLAVTGGGMWLLDVR
ncbi:hypothetical protein [Streptomyces liangshanensis]|uniref:hypothetical protein n=1 Tax=Streptomyces liangshanensis TaxID=2717324 RepID=UPI0036DF7FCB